MNQQLPAPKAFKSSPYLENSSWYKGILMSQLAGEKDTDGIFDLAVAQLNRLFRTFGADSSHGALNKEINQELGFTLTNSGKVDS
jgi:hypothetical protein